MVVRSVGLKRKFSGRGADSTPNEINLLNNEALDIKSCYELSLTIPRVFLESYFLYSLTLLTPFLAPTTLHLLLLLLLILLLCFRNTILLMLLFNHARLILFLYRWLSIKLFVSMV